MFNLKPVKEEFYDYLCRSCMNRKYHVHLTQKDCIFGETQLCPFCRTNQQPVIGLHISGRLKLLFK